MSKRLERGGNQEPELQVAPPGCSRDEPVKRSSPADLLPANVTDRTDPAPKSHGRSERGDAPSAEITLDERI